MTDKTEAQPEALRLAESQRYSDVVHHANVKASLAYVARKTGLGYQETERLLELALQRGDLAEGDYSGRKMENSADDRLASLEAQLVAQTNRAAAAEQQVTALTQRLDMANRLNTAAREQLAQLSARQAAPDGWRLAAQAVIDRWDSPLWRQEVGTNKLINDLRAMLSAAPPPPEREPQKHDENRELAETAMRFVDRAGDVHPGIDDADRICAEFHAAMAAVVDKWHPMPMPPGIGATNAR